MFVRRGCRKLAFGSSVQASKAISKIYQQKRVLP